MNGSNPYKNRGERRRHTKPHPRRVKKAARQRIRDLEAQTCFRWMDPLAPWDADDADHETLDPPSTPT
jgi:hypothetical protein